MLFSSLPFLLGFLPLVVAGAMLAARIAGARGAVAFLAASSFVFYGWHYPPYVVLLALTIAVNYWLAGRIEATASKSITAMAVALNLGLLGWFKYAGFLAEMVFAVTGVRTGLPAILLPLGISFFTFQQIAYLIDIYQRKAKQGALLDYVFLISFFPQLIAGPIVHHKEVIPQLRQGRFATFRAEDVAAGVFLFSIGLAKKVLIADNLAVGADTLFYAQAQGLDISMAEAWLGMLCYTFQIYFDFSGYSDMALGLGLVFGLQLPVNFRSPYKALNIVDFWRRWNITLSTFLRDYLYLPLGGNRRGPVRRYANLWIVMLLGGLWHGAGWQFVVWGGLHGFYLTISHLWTKSGLFRMPAPVSVALTFLCVVVAWVFFRASDFTQAFDILLSMAAFASPAPTELHIFEKLDATLAIVALAALISWFSPNALELTARLQRMQFADAQSVMALRVVGVLAAAALFKTYSGGSNAFIYFQF